MEIKKGNHKITEETDKTSGKGMIMTLFPLFSIHFSNQSKKTCDVQSYSCDITATACAWLSDIVGLVTYKHHSFQQINQTAQMTTFTIMDLSVFKRCCSSRLEFEAFESHMEPTD